MTKIEMIAKIKEIDFLNFYYEGYLENQFHDYKKIKLLLKKTKEEYKDLKKLSMYYYMKTDGMKELYPESYDYNMKNHLKIEKHLDMLELKKSLEQELFKKENTIIKKVNKI